MTRKLVKMEGGRRAYFMTDGIDMIVPLYTANRLAALDPDGFFFPDWESIPETMNVVIVYNDMIVLYILSKDGERYLKTNELETIERFGKGGVK